MNIMIKVSVHFRVSEGTPLALSKHSALDKCELKNVPLYSIAKGGFLCSGKSIFVVEYSNGLMRVWDSHFNK